MTKIGRILTPAEKSAVMKAKARSPWAKFAHCDTANAQRSHIRYLKNGRKS